MTILYDTTERALLESKLQQSSKMETVGTLAGGIAHDFNNQLTVVVANLEMARALSQSNDQLDLCHDAALSAAMHCSKMTADLLSFSRARKSEMQPIDLAALLQETQRFLASTLPTSVELQVSIRRDVPPILGDGTELQQVLLNLAINASDAMNGKGTLALGLDLIEDLDADSDDQSKTSQHVLLTVEDDGPGIPTHIRSRIFEPFFTTKGPGKGTGLGLAAVHGVVSGHGGTIDVENLAIGGARFTIALPCTPPTTLEGFAFSPKPDPVMASNLTILVADDEAAIRDVLRLWLTSKGHVVVEASDGQHAVEQFELHSETIDLLLVDLTMPRLDGASAILRIREAKPRIPAILASGNLNRTDAAIPKDVVQIAKPYSFEDLGRAVETLTRTS